LIIASAVCGLLFVREYKTAQTEILEYSILRESYTSTGSFPTQYEFPTITDPIGASGVSDILDLPKTEVDFESLLRINPDTMGWINIPNTKISYPVVQTVDNHKYLKISFEGKQSNAGTPFADKGNNMKNLDTNTIIYGHNMGTGRTDMFGTLLFYMDYEYFTENRFIQFDTIYQNFGWWEVFAVIEFDVRNTDFNYQQLAFQNDDDFIDWIAELKAFSIHDVNVDISPNDRILTLSTCDRSKFGQNGRLLVFAVLN